MHKAFINFDVQVLLKHVLFTYKYLLQKFHPYFSPRPFSESSLVDLVEVFQGVGGSGLDGGGVRLPVSWANLKMKFGIKYEMNPSDQMYFDRLSNFSLKRAINQVVKHGSAEFLLLHEQ